MTSDSSTPPPAERRIVLHPRTASARRLDRSRVDGGHVRGYTTDTDEVLEYMQTHRRLALATFVPVIIVITVLLLLTVVWRGLGSAQFFGINVLWLVLGPLTLFSILAVTVAHERRALRLEQRWMETHR